MKRCAAEALARFGLFDAGELYISFVSQRTIQRLNREYRGIDAATDVLSFPSIEWKEAAPGDVESLSIYPDKNPQTGKILLGDVVICPQRAMEQAQEYGHSPLRELCFLTVHGVLHLLGLDHETDEDDLRMQGLSESILGDFDIVRPNSIVRGTIT
jgi:probable rRNA maturation factor